MRRIASIGRLASLMTCIAAAAAVAASSGTSSSSSPAPAATRPTNRQATFWRWFENNEQRLYSFENDMDRVIDEIAIALKQVNEDLTFELGPERDGQREFVISADGRRSAFDDVRDLARAAPKLKRWKVTAFKPRREVPPLVRSGEVTLNAADISYALFRQDGQLAVQLFVPEAVAASETGRILAYVMLTWSLGEYDTVVRIEHCEVLSAGTPIDSQRNPFTQLPAQFDRMVADEPAKR